MLYIIIGIGLLFIALGFVITVDNAKYLLAGYNTMSKEQQEKVDLKTYISYLNKFQIILGISFIVLGSGIYFIIGSAAAGLFMAAFPILAFIFFIWNSHRMKGGLRTKMDKWAIAVLVATLAGVLWLFANGYKEHQLLTDNEKITITGSYGETLSPAEISTIELVTEIPPIKYKVNGFATGDVRKGYFKTKEGETVKLILNAKNSPYLLITKRDGGKVYYAAKQESSEVLLGEIKKAFPGMRNE